MRDDAGSEIDVRNESMNRPSVTVIRWIFFEKGDTSQGTMSCWNAVMGVTTRRPGVNLDERQCVFRRNVNTSSRHRF